ncbi:hypothetical protein [Herbaspirillum camelliae]|nr:hypothetical protein [Herbaspirillum camelliae]
MKRLPPGGRFIIGARGEACIEELTAARSPGLHPPTIFKTSMEIWNECNR